MLLLTANLDIFLWLGIFLPHLRGKKLLVSKGLLPGRWPQAPACCKSGGATRHLCRSILSRMACGGYLSFSYSRADAPPGRAGDTKVASVVVVVVVVVVLLLLLCCCGCILDGGVSCFCPRMVFDLF